MNMQRIRSNNIVNAAGYDPDTQTLDVEFNGGEITRFTGVDKWKSDDLMAANDPDKVEMALARIRKRATSAQKILTPLQQLPVNECLAESALINNFGERGTALRTEHDEIQRRLSAMPVVKSSDELKDVQAKLAAVNPRSDVEEIAMLLNCEAALSRIIDTSKPELAQLYARLEALERQNRQQKASAAVYELENQQRAEKKRARLAELERLINDPMQPPVPPGLSDGYAIVEARRFAKDVLCRERDQLRGHSAEAKA
jgi:type I site-specific restriction-modification system R (restriction) subunit